MDKNELLKRKRTKSSIQEERELFNKNVISSLNDDEDKFMKELKSFEYKPNKSQYKGHKISFKKYDKISKTEFTPFDLREEKESGFFDDNNYFIRNKHKEQIDPWYESVKDEIKEQEIQQQNDNSENDFDNKSKSSSSENYSKYGEEDLYYKEEKITKEEQKEINDNIKEYRIKLSKLLLNRNENVNNALKRMRPNKKDNDVEKKEKFDKLLEIISKLTELSFFDVYTDRIDNILRSYGKFVLYEFKYKTITGDKEEIFGDFLYEQMKEWVKNNYFENTETLKFEFIVIKPHFITEDEENSIIFNKWFSLNDKMFCKLFKF